MEQFESFKASRLYCRRCAKSMPVRERLLLILPDKDLYEYLCTGCGDSLGEREVSLAEKRRPPCAPRAFAIAANKIGIRGPIKNLCASSSSEPARSACPRFTP
jgi:hypothetical protein